MTPNVKNVVIDGLIFAGKTTAISNLKARLLSSTDTTFNFFEEPVNSWMNEGWLEKYYSNISKFASSFQIRIIMSHIQQKRRKHSLTTCLIYGVPFQVVRYGSWEHR